MRSIQPDNHSVAFANFPCEFPLTDGDTTDEALGLFFNAGMVFAPWRSNSV